MIDSLETFNSGQVSGVDHFAPDVVFTVPGKSALAGIYRGREGVSDFFGGLHSRSGGTFKVEPREVLANDEHMVLFLHLTGQHDGKSLDVVIAGFHSDRGPDGWRKATFLPDDLAGFDRFFAP
jgi:ketosteroid isomerase-like protein